MAVFSSILGFAGAPSKIAALANTTSSAEVVLGNKVLFAIVGSGSFYLKLGKSGMSAAAVTDFLIPSGTVITLDMTSQYDSLRVFNNSGGAIDVHIQPLSRH